MMKITSCFIPFCILFGLATATKLHAQALNDEMKKQLRQSLITPEKRPGNQQYQTAPQILPNQDREILKVSPTTKLPTKSDRIQMLHPPEEYKINIETNVTNSTPIDERPRGSVRYEFVGKNFVTVETSGTRPAKAAFDTGPIRKRHKKKSNILKAFQK